MSDRDRYRALMLEHLYGLLEVDEVRELEERESLEQLRRALLNLRPEEQEVFLLRQNGGLTYEEIAEILGIPGGTVRSRINRARIMLKDKLKGFAKTEL